MLETEKDPGMLEKGGDSAALQEGGHEWPCQLPSHNASTGMVQGFLHSLFQRHVKIPHEKKFVDRSIQKGFWRGSDGVTEHTELLAHMLRDAKRRQRSIMVTLLDLKKGLLKRSSQPHRRSIGLVVWRQSATQVIGVRFPAEANISYHEN